jgi:hypothetical protein
MEIMWESRDGEGEGEMKILFCYLDIVKHYEGVGGEC